MSFSIFSFLHFFYTICLCNLFICSVQSYLLLYPQAINNYTSNRPWSKHESLTRWCVHGHLCCHVSSSSAFLSDQRTTSKTGPPWRHLGRCRCRAHIPVVTNHHKEKNKRLQTTTFPIIHAGTYKLLVLPPKEAVWHEDYTCYIVLPAARSVHNSRKNTN